MRRARGGRKVAAPLRRARARPPRGGGGAPPPPPPPPAAAAAFLARARAYRALARSLPYAIADDGVTRAIEAALIDARRADPSLQPEAMHAWLETARLAALSFGETALSHDRWAYVRALDAHRAQRVLAAGGGARGHAAAGATAGGLPVVTPPR